MKKIKSIKVCRWMKRFLRDRSGLEFWEYMVLAIVMGLVIWAMRPLLIDLFTTIITTLKDWWVAQIGT